VHCVAHYQTCNVIPCCVIAGLLRLPEITASAPQHGRSVEVTRGCTIFVQRPPEQTEPEEAAEAAAAEQPGGQAAAAAPELQVDQRQPAQQPQQQLTQQPQPPESQHQQALQQHGSSTSKLQPAAQQAQPSVHSDPFSQLSAEPGIV
jgi:hypothetical protein